MPDLSYHEDSKALSTSHRERKEPLPQREAQATVETEIENRKLKAAKPLLALLSLEERRHFSASIEHDPSETISMLARILHRERRARQQQWALRIAGSGLLGILGFGVVSSRLMDAYSGLAFFSAIFALPLLGYIARSKPRGEREQAAFDYLLQLEDKRSVGLLLELWRSVSANDQYRIQKAMIVCLPQLDHEDGLKMTALQRERLHGMLHYSYYLQHSDLRLAAIAALERVGGRDSLGSLYQIAAGEAAVKREQAVRAAAQQCLHTLYSRLDFGGPEKIPEYILRLFKAPSSPASPVTVHADSLYALIVLLPKLTRENYRQILNPTERDRLCGLLDPATLGLYGLYVYDKLKLYREIVRTLERVGDIRAMNMLRHVAVMEAPSDGAKQLRAAAQEALRVLRQQVAKEKVSKTLLRASSAPDAQPDELLRAAAPAESETAPDELLRASGTQWEGRSAQGAFLPAADKDILIQDRINSIRPASGEE